MMYRHRVTTPKWPTLSEAFPIWTSPFGRSCLLLPCVSSNKTCRYLTIHHLKWANPQSHDIWVCHGLSPNGFHQNRPLHLIIVYIQYIYIILYIYVFPIANCNNLNLSRTNFNIKRVLSDDTPWHSEINKTIVSEHIRKADAWIMINPKPVRSFTLAPSGCVVRNCKAQLKAFAKHYRRTQVYPGMLTWMLSRCWSFLGIGHRLGYHIRISR